MGSGFRVLVPNTRMQGLIIMRRGFFEVHGRNTNDFACSAGVEVLIPYLLGTIGSEARGFRV